MKKKPVRVPWKNFCAVILSAVILFAFNYSAGAAPSPVEVAVTGIEGEKLDNVRAALDIPSGIVRNGDVNMPWLERFEKQVPDKVKRALEPFGHYDVRTKTRIEKTTDGYVVIVDVSPGRPTLVADVSLAIEGPGAKENRLNRAVDSFPLKKGDVFDHTAYEAGKTQLREAAFARGYLDADFSVSRVEVSLRDYSARIEILLDTGPFYVFGDWKILGGEAYSDAFLRRHMAFRKGEPFSYNRIYRTQLNFINSERFREAVVEPDKETAENFMVPITIRLEPALPKRLRFGIGYGTDTGPRASAHYRDLNISGEGRELSADLVVSERLQAFVADFRLPGRRIESFTGFQFRLQNEDISSYTSRFASLEANRTWDFGRGRLGTAYLRLQREDSEVGEQDVTATLVLPGVRYSRQRYDNLIRPRRGYNYALELRGTDAFLGSDVGVAQVLANGRYLLPLPWDLMATFRAQGAASYEKDPLSDMPASLRFFTGGDNSVRGFSYNSLGPTDSTGTVVGGKNLIVGSVELEKAFPKNFSAAVFYDTGNAFNDLSDLELYRSVGIGVRYYTPVGAIRLDVAHPIDYPDSDYRIHFSLGFQL